MLADNLENWAKRERQEGRMTTLESTLRKLIKLKFGEPPAWADEKIKQASAEQLDEWTGNTLMAETLEAVFMG